jgi:hypothetical protein
MLAQQTFAHVKRTGTRKVRHGIATLYKGVVQGDSLEIWWLDNLALPARIQRHGSAGRFSMTLLVLHFGDMAHDPFVRKVQQLDAERRGVERVTRPVPHAH